MHDPEYSTRGDTSRNGFDALLRDYDLALTWVAGLAQAVGPHDLDRPTPCTDYTVRLLLGHLIGTAYRGLATATGAPVTEAPHVVTDVADHELAQTYNDLACQIRAAWAVVASPRQRLLAPWGECSALEAARGFIVETLVHGWDLATALYPHHPDPRTTESIEAAAASAMPYVNVPDRLRGRAYGKPAAVADDASALTRLAARLGHYRHQ